MDSGSAATASAVAAAFSAGAAVASLLVARTAKRIQENSVDFSNCINVITQLSDAQRKVFQQRENEDAWKFEFRELLNLLEGLAMLLNDGRFPSSTAKYTEMFLDEALGWIRNNTDLQQLMDASMTGPDTFGELRRYAARKHMQIRGLALTYEKEKGP